jgi:hypothetical protein
MRQPVRHPYGDDVANGSPVLTLSSGKGSFRAAERRMPRVRRHGSNAGAESVKSAFKIDVSAGNELNQDRRHGRDALLISTCQAID